MDGKALSFMIKVVFGVLFFVVITPVGLLLRLFGVDYLDRRIGSEAKSYWRKRL